MRCRWCGRPVWLTRDLWLTEDGQLCTPQMRGAVCALHHYRAEFGIDPLALLNHDLECACQRTIMHLPERGVPVTTQTEAPAIDLLSQYSATQYLLWSGTHQKWWAREGWGYTDDRDEAGRFTCVMAVAYVLRSAESGDPERVARMVRDVPCE